MKVVYIDELEFRHAYLSAEEILALNGIVPYLPYEHEQLIRHGGVVHRYIQPPRRPRPLLREEDAS